MSEEFASNAVDSKEYLRLKAENHRLKQELRDARRGSPPETIIGMRDIVLVISPSAEITYANGQAESHFGVSRQRLIGMPLIALSSSDLQGSALSRLVEDSLSVKSPVSIEITLDGAAPQDIRTFLATATPTPGGTQLLISDRTQVRRMKDALARYISPQVLEAVLKSGVDPYQARKYELTVLFADLRGFTMLSSQKPAEEVKKLIDEYLTVQIETVLQEGATLDKIVGDEVMALFGAPLPAGQHSLWAINTALKMREGHRRLMKLWTARGLKACPLGIGINSGEMVVGHIGSKQQMNYTVLGHNVNLGARLCSAAEGGEILISERCFQLAREDLEREPEAIWRPVKFVRGKVLNAKGIAQPIQTVSVIEA